MGLDGERDVCGGILYFRSHIHASLSLILLFFFPLKFTDL